MNPQMLFSLGNVIADASIAAFAIITWLHENQNRRFHRLIALLLSEGSLSSLQAAVLEAWAFSGDQRDLDKTARKYNLTGKDRDKLLAITRNLATIRLSMLLTLVLFLFGLSIEAYALYAGW
jgi:hypothetical protein